MSGYKIIMRLVSNTEMWREVEIPDDINFDELNRIIQVLFGFENSHMWEFTIPKQNSEEVFIGEVIRTIDMDEAGDISISEVFGQYTGVTYEYDFGDSWLFLVYKSEETDYDGKTAILTNYAGKYSPSDDFGGTFVFDEIMEALDDEEELEYALDEYGMDMNYLASLEFEKKFKKGSEISFK